ncbi:MAG: XRE family transcriptional regulator [Verrucomicrobiaceae bacterium]|nr:MAG: XRE family transcriptional regulator [Verrucomicrobiaceae bacterium]
MGIDVCQVLGANIRERRRLMGWTLSRLGKALGISYQQVQKYEKGTNRVPVDMLISLVEIFECSLDELCGLHERQVDLELIVLFRRISRIKSAEVKRKVIGFIELLDEPQTA